MIADEEVRCVHDLVATWCAECASPRPRRRGPSEVRRHFTARYDGRCARCDERYYAGQEIGVTTDSEYLCGGCS
ncbi:MAG TPA: hypothetical protein VFX53_04605 [Pedococcus sp.]|nr:hypothetical protein [Pedococcus sp.]